MGLSIALSESNSIAHMWMGREEGEEEEVEEEEWEEEEEEKEDEAAES